MTLEPELTDSPDPTALAELGQALGAFNAADVGASGHRPLALFLRDERGGLQGGLSGQTAWGWLYVQWLWIAEGIRGQGWAGRLLRLAEAEALARGCHGAWIDTFSPTALRVYEAAGYRAFGRLDAFPIGRSRTFLSKSLGDAPWGDASPSPNPTGGTAR